MGAGTSRRKRDDLQTSLIRKETRQRKIKDYTQGKLPSIHSCTGSLRVCSVTTGCSGLQ